MSRESLQALAENKEPGFTRRDEEVVYQFSTEILGGHFVSDETFAAALAELGEQGVVDLIGSLGNRDRRPGGVSGDPEARHPIAEASISMAARVRWVPCRRAGAVSPGRVRRLICGTR